MQKILFLISSLTTKAFPALLPLGIGIFTSSIEDRVEVSNFSIEIQNFSALIIFGALTRYSIKIKSMSNSSIEMAAVTLKIIFTINSVLLVLLTLILHQAEKNTIAAILTALVFSYLSVDIIKSYTKREGWLETVKLNSFSLSLVLICIALAVTGHTDKVVMANLYLCLTFLLTKFIKKRVKNILRIQKFKKIIYLFFLNIKTNYIVFLIGYVTPLTLYLNGRIIKDNMGAADFTDYIQTYSLFSILVFIPNILGQTLLIDLNRNLKWEKFIEFIGLSLLLQILVAGIFYFFNEVFLDRRLGINRSVLWILVSAFIFIILIPSSQMLFVMKLNKILLFINISWCILLILFVSQAKTIDNIWQGYAISFLFILSLQYYIIWKVKND